MGAMASQITSLTIVYSIVYSGADQRKHQSSPGAGEFPAQMASNAENVSIWWRHHECGYSSPMPMDTEMDKNKNRCSSIIFSVSKQDSYALNVKKMYVIIWNYWWKIVLGSMKLLLKTSADLNYFMPTNIVQKT